MPSLHGFCLCQYGVEKANRWYWRLLHEIISRVPSAFHQIFSKSEAMFQWPFFLWCGQYLGSFWSIVDGREPHFWQAYDIIFNLLLEKNRDYFRFAWKQWQNRISPRFFLAAGHLLWAGSLSCLVFLHNHKHWSLLRRVFDPRAGS